MSIKQSFANDFNTTGRVLAAAEILFAEKGLDDVSLRELTSLARVNLAAVNYHFGSKDGLKLALFEQVAARANKERMMELDAYLESLKNDERPELEPIISIFLSAYVGVGMENQGVVLARFMMRHRVSPHPEITKLIDRHFAPWSKRVLAALVEACPYLDESEVYWRYLFMTSTIALTITDRNRNNRIYRLSDKRVDASNTPKLKRALIRFLLNAFSAP